MIEIMTILTSMKILYRQGHQIPFVGSLQLDSLFPISQGGNMDRGFIKSFPINKMHKQFDL